MKNIVIFSGTTEGRMLAESFAIAGIAVSVCVATEYGQEVMESSPLIDVNVGRMDEGEIRTFLEKKQADLVFDATHPYATLVTENIKKACRSLDLPLKRIIRDRGEDCHTGYRINMASDTREAVSMLLHIPGNIFLTTGSRELLAFAALRERLYVRVLPSREAIGLCERAGIEKSHIIAQQGPFTCEENLALIRRYDIGVLVTKSSGRNGGYQEKLKAAETAGIETIVIERTPREPSEEKRERTLTLIGAGCGEGTLTADAIRAIEDADLIIGSSRLLAYRIVRESPAPKESAYKAEKINEILSEKKPDRPVVLYSGDSGFYSGARSMMAAALEGMRLLVIPGISSVAALSALTHIPYDNAFIKSYHGRTIDSKELAQAVKSHRASFILLSGKDDLYSLLSLFPDKRIIAAQDLGGELEWVGEIDKERVDGLKGSLFTVLVTE